MTAAEADDWLVAHGYRKPYRYVAICDACGIGGKVMAFTKVPEISACPYCGRARRAATASEAELANE